MKRQQQGVKRVARAFQNSMQGLKFAWKNEAAFREEVVLTVFLLPLAVYLGDNYIEQILLISAIFFVLIAELLNSAIEAAIDRIGSEHHPLSGGAKDLGSAAVMFAMFLFVIIWGLVLTH